MLSRPLDISAVIDGRPVSRWQRRALALLGACVLMDGFDVMAMAFVAPALIHAWHVDKAALGPVFGAGLAGMLCGSLLLGWLADRIGRKPVLIGASLFFAALSWATAQAGSIEQLIALRFVAGIGLGGIMPNATALAGELSPRRHRAALTMAVSSGFTVGAALGGLVDAAMIPAWGWQSVFLLGGVLPAVVALLVAAWVPESMHWRLLNGGTRTIGRELRRIDPSLDADARSMYLRPAAGRARAPIAELFREGRTRTTLLLWAVNGLNLLVLYFLSSWIPVLAHDAGLSMSAAVLLGTTLLVGGIVGAAVMGPLIDRIGYGRVLVPAAIAEACFIVAIGMTGGSLPLMFATVALAGFCLYGGQPAIVALAGAAYPTSLRATGIGWSLGIGRIGSIAGPVLGGLLIQLHWSMSELLLATAVPVLATALLLAALAARLEQPEAVAVPQPA